jgi:hypothetical protein
MAAETRTPTTSLNDTVSGHSEERRGDQCLKDEATMLRSLVSESMVRDRYFVPGLWVKCPREYGYVLFSLIDTTTRITDVQRCTV